MDRVFGFGAPFLLRFSSNSDRLPRLFRWTNQRHEATNPVTVCMDGGIVKGLELPGRKIAWLAESPAIYTWQRVGLIVKQNLEKVLRAYEVLLTSDRSLCRLDPRIRYHPAGSNLPWIPEAQYGLHPKTRMCSMFASTKQLVRGHEIRQAYAARLEGRLDLFGGACGSPRLGGPGAHPDKSEGLLPYRFSVAMENCRTDLYYSEKLTDCFATGTVPIYWGPAAIGELFDERGILWLTEDFDPSELGEERYESMLPAIRRNLELVSRLESSDDLLYRRYLKDA